jgi:transposase
VSMTGSYPKAEIVTGPERRRRWTVAEKLSMVAETREPGVTVSLVARRRGVSPNLLFTWRRLAEQGALTATQAEEEVVPASAFRAQQEQIRELQRLLGKRRWRMRFSRKRSILPPRSQKKRTLRSLSLPKDGSP